MNLCIFTGNLVADPDLKSTNSGKAVASFKLANNDIRDKPEFIQCTAWEKTAELVSNYCRKGSKLMVHGRWNTNKWTDKEGNARYTTQIMVDRVEFLTPRSQDQQDNSGGYEPPPMPNMNGTGEDVPF